MSVWCVLRHGNNDSIFRLQRTRITHKNVSDLFDEYERINITSRKKSLVSQICVDLTIHAQVEEEILYPALNEILKDKRLAPQAILKHVTLKGLIAEVENADGKEFDAKVKVLSAYVKDHINEKQNQILRRVIATRLDVIDIGARIASRKEELVAENARLGVKITDPNRAQASIQGYC